jgi:serine protease Do
LRGRAASRVVSPKEIAHHFNDAVVVVATDEGSGTGFVIGSSGYILTCAHVLPRFGEPQVKYLLRSGTQTKTVEAAAAVVRADRENDLALLKIEPARPLTTVQIGLRSKVEMGESVTVIGNPGMGQTILSHTLTTGVVSNPNRQLENVRLIQTSAAVNPGSSGGPMFNDRGQVIGLVVAKANIENTGFAIPVETIAAFLGSETSARASSAPAPGTTPTAAAGSTLRWWTDATGKFRTEAVLLGVKSGQVTLRKKTGETIVVPVAKLSDADKSFVLRWIERQKRGN